MLGFVPFQDPEHRVPQYRSVDGPIIGSQAEAALVASAFEVIADAVNQAGAELWSNPAGFGA